MCGKKRMSVLKMKVDIHGKNKTTHFIQTAYICFGLNVSIYATHIYHSFLKPQTSHCYSFMFAKAESQTRKAFAYNIWTSLWLYPNHLRRLDLPPNWRFSHLLPTESSAELLRTPRGITSESPMPMCSRVKNHYSGYTESRRAPGVFKLVP